MLDQKIKSRIFEDAKAYARKHGMKEIGYYMINYEAGASAEAERAQGLAIALEKIEACAKEALPSRISVDDPIAVALYNCRHFASESLTKYNNSK